MMRSKGTLIERLLDKIDVTESGCWQWTGSIDKFGYGRLGIGDRQTGTAHRCIYTALVGTIPDGLEIDHLCRNKACVNPDHLEPVTHEENIRRRYAAMTHCTNGHPITEATIFVTATGRKCRTCREVNERKRRVK